MIKPILFNTEMVKAILDGQKTVTRRLIKFPNGMTGRLPESGRRDYLYYPCGIKRPPYQLGDILYVRETWKQATSDPAGGGYDIRDHILYKADEPQDHTGMMVEDRWHPSIHMPKKAARIWLRVTAVRVERLQDITGEEAAKEGCWFGGYKEDGTLELQTTSFEIVWNRTVKKSDIDRYGWDANPWVWVIEFERCEKPEETNA